MVHRLVRLVAMVVLSWALIGPGVLHARMVAPTQLAGTTQVAPQDHPCGSMASDGHKAASDKSAMPACLTDLGCLLVVGLPTTSAPAVRPYKWAVVDYWSQTATVRGISFQPALGPPISVL